MRHIYFVILFLLTGLLGFSQSSGFGYNLDLAGQFYESENGEYSQTLASFIQNGFIRFHSEEKWHATQLMFGYRKDYANFQNRSEFLSPDGLENWKYNSDAEVFRDAWRLGLIKQFQFGKNRKRFCYGINAGVMYERTIDAGRLASSRRNDYDLMGIVQPNNFGWLFGAELRWRWFSIGYRTERLFNSVLDRDLILKQELNLVNSTELRGFSFNPLMHYFTIGVCIDFY